MNFGSSSSSSNAAAGQNGNNNNNGGNSSGSAIEMDVKNQQLAEKNKCIVDLLQKLCQSKEAENKLLNEKIQNLEDKLRNERQERDDEMAKMKNILGNELIAKDTNIAKLLAEINMEKENSHKFDGNLRNALKQKDERILKLIESVANLVVETKGLKKEIHTKEEASRNELKKKNKEITQMEEMVEQLTAKAKGPEKKIPEMPMNRWNAKDCAHQLFLVEPSNLTAQCEGLYCASVRAEMAISQKYIIYYELKVVSMTQAVSIGLAPKSMPLNGVFVGYHQNSYSYGFSGTFNGHHRVGSYLGRKRPPWIRFGNGDTIGCGVNLTTRQIIYTKNGERIDTTGLLVDWPEEGLFPCVSLGWKDDMVEANFGPALLRVRSGQGIC